MKIFYIQPFTGMPTSHWIINESGGLCVNLHPWLRTVAYPQIFSNKRQIIRSVIMQMGLTKAAALLSSSRGLFLDVPTWLKYSALVPVNGGSCSAAFVHDDVGRAEHLRDDVREGHLAQNAVRFYWSSPVSVKAAVPSLGFSAINLADSVVYFC